MKLLFAMILMSAAVADQPPEWLMQSQSSTLTFVASYDGGGFGGGFDAFDVALKFDPEHPASASLAVTIETTSINTDNEERDQTLATGEWFNFDDHPQAIYQADGFEQLTNGRWSALGQLTLKGITRPVPIDFSWEQQADGELFISGRARMTGDAEVNRIDFAIGEGDWADPTLIGHQVFVEFDLNLTRSASAQTD